MMPTFIAISTTLITVLVRPNAIRDLVENIGADSAWFEWPLANREPGQQEFVTLAANSAEAPRMPPLVQA